MADADFSWAGPALRQRLSADPLGAMRDRGLNVPADLPEQIVGEMIRITHLLWLNGEITCIDQFIIDPADEGLLFGRGVWESTRTIDGDPWLWPQHLQRLERTAELLNIAIAPARLPTSEQVTQYVRSLTTQDVIIRLNVTAGAPGRPGMVWMTAAVQPANPPAIRLRTFANPVQKGQAYLTLKTFQYATRLRLAQQAGLAGFDSALLLDAEGNIQEAAHANIFLRLPNGWVTPQADGGLLPGTVRQQLLERSPLAIREQAIHQSLLNKVQEAFVTNSNVGIVPVSQIDGQSFSTGADTLELMKWFCPAPESGVQYRFAERVATPR